MSEPSPDSWGARIDGESLERWLGELRADEAAAARRRESWLRRQDAEATTLAGLLRDFAERGTTVVVRTVTGARHVGRVATIAADFAAITTTTANTVLIRERAIATIAAEPGSRVPGPSGDRPPLDRYFDDVVAALAAERPRIVATFAAGGVVSGELREVGNDVIGIATGAATSRLTYVPLSALLDVSLTGSG